MHCRCWTSAAVCRHWLHVLSAAVLPSARIRGPGWIRCGDIFCPPGALPLLNFSCRLSLWLHILPAVVFPSATIPGPGWIRTGDPPNGSPLSWALDNAVLTQVIAFDLPLQLLMRRNLAENILYLNRRNELATKELPRTGDQRIATNWRPKDCHELATKGLPRTHVVRALKNSSSIVSRFNRKRIFTCFYFFVYSNQTLDMGRENKFLLDLEKTMSHRNIWHSRLETHYKPFFTFCWPCISLLCSSSGGQNCIIQHLVSSHSVSGRPVHRLREDLCTGRTHRGVMMPDAV